MNWSAAPKPGALESRIANLVREHCAACHGLDGGGRNRFEAAFYPPIPRLTGDTQEMSDSELFFLTANGVALSGMPAFGGHHSAEEIWKVVLWMRHLPSLTQEGRKKIEQEASDQEYRHQETMRQGARGKILVTKTDPGICMNLAFRKAPRVLAAGARTKRRRK